MANNNGIGRLKCKIIGKSSNAENLSSSATASNGKASFTCLSATYPFKFLTPKPIISFPKTLTAFMVSYGGGLVSGDIIDVDVDVGNEVSLCMLTQASTKVYKRRPCDTKSSATIPIPESPSNHSVADVHQNFTAHIGSDALLAFLPEPVTCFKNSSYNQTQLFSLSASGSLILLDWFTSGRASRGESWQFNRYASKNIVKLEKKTIIRDSWVLECDESSEEKRYLNRVKPYNCFAVLIFVGPKAMAFAKDALAAFEQVKVNGNMRRGNASGVGNEEVKSLVWSVSPISLPIDDDFSNTEDCGAIIRAASKETGEMRAFLSKRLELMHKEFGEHIFQRQI
ncbi:hypothetical protein HK098_000435 [Nowakowskiella sp. JEL0407]|nr:hypothetical protein HK098_000435 [Nowakowskiella sp. JEL0407]